MNQWEEEDRRRQGEMFTLVHLRQRRGQAADQARSKATAAPPSSDDGRYVSTASDAIYRAKCDLTRFAICRVPAQCSTWRAGSSVVRFLAPPSSDPSPVLALTLPFAKSALRFYPLAHKNLIASCQRRPALASL